MDDLLNSLTGTIPTVRTEEQEEGDEPAFVFDGNSFAHRAGATALHVRSLLCNGPLMKEEKRTATAATVAPVPRKLQGLENKQYYRLVEERFFRSRTLSCPSNNCHPHRFKHGSRYRRQLVYSFAFPQSLRTTSCRRVSHHTEATRFVSVIGGSHTCTTNVTVCQIR